MNAKVAAVGIFVIVGFLGTRVVIFMQEADQQINKQAYEDGFYQMPNDPLPNPLLLEMPSL